jgi:hypothetical protein
VSDDEEWEDQKESYVKVDPDELPGERPAEPSNDERVGWRDKPCDGGGWVVGEDGCGAELVVGWRWEIEPSASGVGGVASSASIDKGLVNWLGRQSSLGGRTDSSTEIPSSMGEFMDSEVILLSIPGTLVRGRGSPCSSDSSGSGSGRDLREWRK